MWKLAFVSLIWGQNLDFWHKNSIFLLSWMKYSTIYSSFGAKIQISLKIKICKKIWIFEQKSRFRTVCKLAVDAFKSHNSLLIHCSAEASDNLAWQLRSDWMNLEWLYTSSFLSVMSGDKSELLLSRNISTWGCRLTKCTKKLRFI